MQTKEVQGQLWSTAPDDWVKFFEPVFIPMYRAVLKKTHLREGSMLLDAGCGSGLFLTMAAATGSAVHGIDAATGLLDHAKRRLPAVSFLHEDLEALPFADESFDLVTGFNSFQYAGDIIGALKEANRVVKKDGTVLIGIWAKRMNVMPQRC